MLLVPMRLLVRYVYRHKAQSPRAQRSRDHSQEHEEVGRNQDKLLGPRSLERDPALTTLHYQNKSPEKVFNWFAQIYS